MDNVLCKEAGARIRAIRKTRGLTRDALAERAGVSSKFLYEIEQGKKRFSAEVLCRIAEVLDVSCDYIMLGKLVTVKDEAGIAEALSLFNINQQQKLIPLLQMIYELIN